MNFLAPFMAFLRLEAHGRNGARIQPFQRDRFPGHFAIPIFAVFNPPQGTVDLGDQLALAITRSQFQCPVGFFACAVGDVGNVTRAILQTFDHGQDVCQLSQVIREAGGRVLAVRFATHCLADPKRGARPLPDLEAGSVWTHVKLGLGLVDELLTLPQMAGPATS